MVVKKTKNDGSKSQEKFVEMMEANRGKQVYVYRMTDTKEIKGALGTGFAKGAPSDYIVTVNGQMFYAEVKSTQEPVSFKYSSFTKAQIIGMTKQVSAGGKYNVYIHHLPSDGWYLLTGASILADMKKKIKSIKFVSIPQVILN